MAPSILSLKETVAGTCTTQLPYIWAESHLETGNAKTDLF